MCILLHLCKWFLSEKFFFFTILEYFVWPSSMAFPVYILALVFLLFWFLFSFSRAAAAVMTMFAFLLSFKPNNKLQPSGKFNRTNNFTFDSILKWRDDFNSAWYNVTPYTIRNWKKTGLMTIQLALSFEHLNMIAHANGFLSSSFKV